MRSRRAILRKRLPSSNHLSSIRRKKKRIALGVSTTYTRIRQEKEESKNNRININVSQLPPLKPLSKEDIKSLSPSNTDGSIVLNRLVESPILAEDILVDDGTITSAKLLSSRGNLSSNYDISDYDSSDSDGSDDMFPPSSFKRKSKRKKLKNIVENPTKPQISPISESSSNINGKKQQLPSRQQNIIRIRGRTSWGIRPTSNNNNTINDNESIVIDANGGNIISNNENNNQQHQHSTISLASLEEANKLVFVPRERNPFIERIEYDQRRVRLLHNKLKSSNEVEPAIQQVGIHVPISGIVNQKSFKKMSEKLSLAPKYIDQLIYGKTGIVDNDGNVNLLKLGVIDVSHITPSKKKPHADHHGNTTTTYGSSSPAIERNINKFGMEEVEMHYSYNKHNDDNNNLNANKSLAKLFHKTSISGKKITGSKSMPNLHRTTNIKNNKSNKLDGRAQSPPWKNGKASARWGEEHYRSTDFICGEKGTSFYSPNTFRRDIPLGSEVDKYKKNERMKHKKSLYDNHEIYINQRKKRDMQLRKHLDERHLGTVKNQAKRYEDFLAAERIKRATMWTDSGKLIDEDAPLRLNHRKHQYKQYIDDGSYQNAMSRRNGLSRTEWHRVFR
jgi:hypothetical protein|eukprot:g151.t1